MSFPRINRRNGKGSVQRPSDRAKFEEGYARIFGSPFDSSSGDTKAAEDHISGKAEDKEPAGSQAPVE